jgi:hydroxyacylglutathione hydrolase
MTIKIIKLEVGPWPMNTYILMSEKTGSVAIIDPGAEADKILETIHETKLKDGSSMGVQWNLQMILITHGHPDHIGAVSDMRELTGAPVYIHPSDAQVFNIEYDHLFENNGQLHLGSETFKTIHTPGHTPGSTCIDLCDQRVIVGDTIFVGGPGKTWSALDFDITIDTMKSIVFKWTDDTIFFPGHGQNGRIGVERPKFESFLARGLPEDLFGDVTWE